MNLFKVCLYISLKLEARRDKQTTEWSIDNCQQCPRSAPMKPATFCSTYIPNYTLGGGGSSANLHSFHHRRVCGVAPEPAPGKIPCILSPDRYPTCERRT